MKYKKTKKKGGGPDSFDRRERKRTIRQQIARTPVRDAVARFGQKLTSLVYKKITVHPTPYMNGRTSVVLDMSHALGRRVIKMMVLTEPKKQLVYFTGKDNEKYTVTEEEFKKEYSFLKQLNKLGLCPKPYSYKIYRYTPTTPLPQLLQNIRKEIFEKKLSVVGTVLQKFFESMKYIYRENLVINIQYGLIDMEKIDGPSLYYHIYSNDEIDEKLACDIYSLVLVLYMKGYSNYDCNKRNILLPSNSYPMMIDTAQVETRKKGFQENNETFKSYRTILSKRLPGYYSEFGQVYNKDEEDFITKFLETSEIITCEELTPVRILLMLECIENSSPFLTWMGLPQLHVHKRSPSLIERIRARYNNETYQ